MKKIIFLLIAFLISLNSNVYAFTFSNFDTPESVLCDPEDGAYYVSNINGGPADKDGNGYISKITPNGSIVIQKFIVSKEGAPLNGPKGLAIVEQTLYVADIDAVRAFDKETGKAGVVFDLSKYQVKFLNDLTAAGNTLYVSDMFGNAIYKIDLETANITLMKQDEELGKPNGLLINPKSKNLIILAWGAGRIMEIDPSGNLHTLKDSLFGLDGIDYDNEGSLFVSSFQKGEIYKIPNYGRGELTTFLNGLTSPADISVDRKKNELLIPSFNSNTVSSVSLKKQPPDKS